MAKKGARELVGMICQTCKSQNYVTERNKVNMAEKSEKSPKLQIKKYCKKCKSFLSEKNSSLEKKGELAVLKCKECGFERKMGL